MTPYLELFEIKNGIMWVKQCHKPSPGHHIFLGGIHYSQSWRFMALFYPHYMYMSGGQNYLLAAMDMTKVGGPLSVVNVFAQI